MANLLPQESQKNIRREYRLRLAVVAAFLLLAVIVFAAVLLVPSLLLSSVKANESEARLAVSRKGETQNLEKEIEAVVLKTNTDATLLSENGNQAFLVSEFIGHLLQTKPDTIAITGIFYEKAKGGALDKASLRGIAANREALSAYVASLETDSYFAEVVLPVSHFVQEKDIDFAMSLKMKARNK